jgi:hypothetical protein
MPISTVQLFYRSQVCSMKHHLRSAFVAICFVTLGCGHAAAQQPQPRDPTQAATGFDKFFLHDQCTAQYPPQPDTCLHERVHEQSFKFGGTVSTPDWSHWEIEVSEPRQTYWLNHYPSVGHTIYKQDFEATIAVAAGATVIIRVTDGNDRQIDNGKSGPDRQQIIPGVVDTPLPGQMLRLDVVRVKTR